MREADLTKLGRWAIPGWIAFLSYIVFVFTDILFTPGCDFENPCNLLKGVIRAYESLIMPSSGAQLVTGIFVIAAGIPLGFIVYQAYFFLRWNSPASRDGIAGLMAGRLSDLSRITEDIDEKDLWQGSKWKKKWGESDFYKRNHKDHWRFIELLFTEAAQKVDSKFQGVSFYQRHRYLHEVVHTIGGSIGAIYVALLAYVFTIGLVKEQSTLNYMIFTVSSCAALFYLINRENLARQDAQRSRKKPNKGSGPFPFATRLFGISFFHPSAGLVFVILTLHFVFNPVLHPPVKTLQDVAVRFVPLLVFFVLWNRSRGDSWRFFFDSDLLTALVIPAITVSVFFFTVNRSYLDWGYLSSSTLFLIANLVLFKNRQNASDDMLAMENYLLKLYIYGGRQN